MSGGVDSSTAAALLLERGCEVIGITLSLYDAPDPDVEGGCCTPDDVHDAHRVCSDLGIPHYVLDYRDAFRQEVVEPFVRAYQEGRTPNPCVLCNNVLKFDRLLEFAGKVGATMLATGHYARIVEEDGELRLLGGADRLKDQSYFLYGIRKEALPRICFPLGRLDKSEVRAAAQRLGVRTSGKPDSQDVCFIPDGRTADFVARAGGAGRPGEIVDETGVALGTHDGVHAFTIGQRRGLGIARPEPLYVRRIDAAKRRLVVATKDRLASTRVHAADMNWIRRPGPAESIVARVRYRSKPTSVARVSEEHGVLLVELARPVDAIAPGQALVLYAAGSGEVLGGGTITAPPC
jgi:tRNA-specific 2-thiouridylase